MHLSPEQCTLYLIWSLVYLTPLPPFSLSPQSQFCHSYASRISLYSGNFSPLPSCPPMDQYFQWLRSFLFLNFTLSSGVHVQKVQVCYIGIHMPWWFAVSIPPSPTLGISPNVIPPKSPHCCHSFPRPPQPPTDPLCNVSLQCPCVLIVQHPLMNENMWCLVFVLVLVD